MIRITTDGACARSCGAGLAAHLPPTLPLRRAIRVLTDVLGRRQLRIAVNEEALLQCLPPARADEWSGFLHWPNGWLGIALPDLAAHELLRALCDMHDLQRMPLLRAAGVLQCFGIAALPARPASRWAAVAGHASSAARAGCPLLDAPGAASRLLSGVRVIDLGRLVAAPLAARILEELGARVIRVRPKHAAEGDGADVRLDLGTVADRAALGDLVADADLLIENGGTAAGDRLTELFAARPPRRRISIRAFRPDTARRHWRGYGFMLEAAEACGYAPHAAAKRSVAAPRLPVLDRCTGLIAAAEAVAWLLNPPDARRRTHRTLSLEGVARMVGAPRPSARRSISHAVPSLQSHAR